jgi:hypothetical protein
MHKQTKKMLLVLVVAAMFLGSTVAYIISSFVPITGGTQAQQGQQQPQTPITFLLEGKLEPDLYSAYLSQGYSIAEFHYSDETSELLIGSIEELPGDLQFQIVVQKLKDLEAGKPALFTVESLRGYAEANLTSSTLEALPALCAVLFSPPADCAFLNQTAAS